ncbi:MAG TPA: hypothetical protein PLQ74_10505 [Pseudomonadota bacterium]|nr:hypothetical protein [Rhodanobacteraceae bacterium]MBP9153915.1 hypothetical protein [Xanthomonadales bacterium]HQW82287.1 hypothetical protein [Pseudomonadota bacterium]
MKEARADAKISRLAEGSVPRANTENLTNRNTQLDSSMQEAREKHDSTMNAAVTGLITSVVSATSQMLAGHLDNGFAQFKTNADALQRDLLNLNSAVASDKTTKNRNVQNMMRLRAR